MGKTIRTEQHAFSAGIISPTLQGRTDLGKNRVGLAECTNAVVLPHGPVTKRPGFQFVHAAKVMSSAVRLLDFVFSDTQTYVVELGHLYARFHADGGPVLEATKAITGATSANPTQITAVAHGYTTGDEVYLEALPGDFAVLNGRYFIVTVTGANTFTVPVDASAFAAYTSGGTAARVFTLTTPYTADQLAEIKHAQSFDVMTLVHPSHAPRELRRLGLSNWTLSVVNFRPDAEPPIGVTVTPTGAGATTYYYRVTTISSTGQESYAPGVGYGAVNDLTAPANYNTVTWAGVAGAIRYRIYRQDPDTLEYQLIGEAPGTSFVDRNRTPDPLSIPPEPLGPIGLLKPANVSASVGVGAPATIYSYWVTSVDADGRESEAGFDFVSNDLTVPGNTNIITWSAAVGAVSYNIYRATGLTTGLGLIANTALLTLTDNNLPANTNYTPPRYGPIFSGSSNYPSAVTYFEQRRVFAATNNAPQTVWMTRSGTESNLTYYIPQRDDDAMTFELASLKLNKVRHLLPFSDLMLLSNSAVWKAGGAGEAAITPATISARPQSYAGAANVRPQMTIDSLLYVQERGQHLADMLFSQERGGYQARDITQWAPHLFEGHTIVDMCFTAAPHPMAWCVRSDGKLIGLTYQPDQDVLAYHIHETAGYFEAVIAIPEGANDAIYAVIRRVINGITVRYIERMASTVDLSPITCPDGSTDPLCGAGGVVPLWSLSGATYSGDSLLVTGKDTIPEDAVYNASGTRLYFIGSNTDRVYQFNLVTPWVLTSAVDSGHSLYVGGQDASPTGLWLNEEESRLYVVGNATDSVYRYDIGTVGDISTGVYSGQSKYVGGEDTQPVGLALSPDETRMIVAGNTNDKIFEYEFTGAGALSSATYNGTSLLISAQDTNPTGICYGENGASIYMVGTTNDRVYRYTQTTAYRLATASYSGDFLSVAAQDGAALGVHVSANGEHMIVTGSVSDTIYRYDMPILDGSDPLYAIPADPVRFVDAGLRIWDHPVQVVANLFHLEGEEVVVNAGGAVITGLTVSGGAITLPAVYARVEVGLPYTTTLETLPIPLSPSLGLPKRIAEMHFLLQESGAAEVGPDVAHLRPLASVVGIAERPVLLNGAWADDPRVFIRHTDPLPFTLLSVSAVVNTGG